MADAHLVVCDGRVYEPDEETERGLITLFFNPHLKNALQYYIRVGVLPL